MQTEIPVSQEEKNECMSFILNLKSPKDPNISGELSEGKKSTSWRQEERNYDKSLCMHSIVINVSTVDRQRIHSSALCSFLALRVLSKASVPALLLYIVSYDLFFPLIDNTELVVPSLIPPHSSLFRWTSDTVCRVSNWPCIFLKSKYIHLRADRHIK